MINGKYHHAKSKKIESIVSVVEQPIFRGFVGGSAIVTKKGFRGLKIDSLWAKNLFDSFETDDEELANYSLQSSLADLNDTVIGGHYGTPYSIGDQGFYVEEQFNLQAKHLSANERIVSTGKQFLSLSEWEAVDSKLSGIAHHNKPKFQKACRRDSFAALAIRKNAFNVAKLMMDKVDFCNNIYLGIDPLVENEEGNDLFVTIKQQYSDLGATLKDIEELKTQAADTVMVPSQVDEMFKKESVILQQFDNLSIFCDSVRANLVKRTAAIEKDVQLQRRYYLRNEEFPASKIWNIAQKDKAIQYITECDLLKGYIADKLAHHKAHSNRFINLADALQEHLDNIVTEMYGGEGSEIGDDDSFAFSHSISTINSLPVASPIGLNGLPILDSSTKSSGIMKLPMIKNTSSRSSRGGQRSHRSGIESESDISPRGSTAGASTGGKSFASSQKDSDTELFYKKLGIKKNDFMTTNSKTSGKNNAALIKNDAPVVYAPIIGTLRESETEVIFYR